jgi:hypothetical protein
MSEDADRFTKALSRTGLKKRKDDEVWDGEVEQFAICASPNTTLLWVGG